MYILVSLAIIATLAVVVSVGIGVIIWAVSNAMKGRNAAVTLAQHVGWKSITPGRPAPECWYGGVAQDRRVCIKTVSLRNIRGTAGNRLQRHLRIVMELMLREPLGAMALRSTRDLSSLHRFEEAFSAKNAERLGPEARKAMMDFVGKGYPTGVRGTTYRSEPGTRNLWLIDRAAIPEGQFDAPVLPDTSTVLIHDHPDLNLTPDEFGALLFEMASIAYALELGR